MSTELLNMAALKEAVIEAANKGGWRNEFQQGWLAYNRDFNIIIRDNYDQTIMTASKGRMCDLIAAAQIMNIDLNQFRPSKKDLLRKWCEDMVGKRLGNSDAVIVVEDGSFMVTFGGVSNIIWNNNWNRFDFEYELYVRNYPIKEGE